MTAIHVLASLAQPLLNRLDPEFAHALTVQALGMLPVHSQVVHDDPRLQMETLGMKFPNPLGLAAGFDKNAAVLQQMLGFGFGFVEAGTVTPLAQNGNPRPRIFRLSADRAVINRLGFNNQGLERAKSRLRAIHEQPGIRGINIGANKDSPDRISDYVTGIRELGTLAAYVTVNISSPNTPGLRGLQNRGELDTLLSAVLNARKLLARVPPLLVKIAPDLDEQGCTDIAELALAHGIDGLIVSNTTIRRPPTLRSKFKSEPGGLSGSPLFSRSTEILRTMRRLTRGKLTLVGVGGIGSGEDAYAKIRAGASLVQLYTSMAYEGPGIVSRIKRELLTYLERDGFAGVADAVGQDL